MTASVAAGVADASASASAAGTTDTSRQNTYTSVRQSRDISILPSPRSQADDNAEHHYLDDTMSRRHYQQSQLIPAIPDPWSYPLSFGVGVAGVAFSR